MKNSTQYILFIVISRTLVFPFFFGIALVGSLIIFTQWIVNFIRFGGEFIAYTDKMSKKTIQDVFMKLSEMQTKDQ